MSTAHEHLLHAFGEVFAQPTVQFLKGTLDEKIDKVRRVVEHPATLPAERAAAEAALRRLNTRAA
jgi:hypothetical protein